MLLQHQLQQLQLILLVQRQLPLRLRLQHQSRPLQLILLVRQQQQQQRRLLPRVLPQQLRQVSQQRQQLQRQRRQLQLRRSLVSFEFIIVNIGIENFGHLGVNMAWNSTGTTVAGTGTLGSAANQFNEPWNLFVDNNYNMYIADSGNHRIQYWPAGASSGTTIAGITGSVGSSATQLNLPSDVFVTSSGNLYVADRMNNRIQYFASGSSTGVTTSTFWGGVGGFRGVQVDSSGFIYASDTSNHALWKNNTVPLGYAGAGGATNQLNGNQGIALDTTINPGYVYIANANQHTIVQWAMVNNVGNVVAGTNGVSGSSTTTMAFPVAVRLDPLGNLFVVDNNNHRIQLYCRYPTIATTAKTLAGTGSLGSTATQLHYPAGLALDKDLNLYVADTSNHRIQKFTRTS